MNRLKILIIEDEILIAEDLKDTLIKFGVTEIKMAHDKAVALEQIMLFKPNLVLLDLNLNKKHDELEGFEIGKYLTNETSIPFIYTTAHANTFISNNTLNSKPISQIKKPYNKSELLSSLNLVLEQLHG